MSSVASLKKKLVKIDKGHQALNQEAKELKLKLAIAEILDWSNNPEFSFNKENKHLSEHYVSVAVSLELLRSIEVQMGGLVTKSSKNLDGACARMVVWDDAMKDYAEASKGSRNGRSHEAIIEKFEVAIAGEKEMDPMKTLHQMVEDSVHRLGLVVNLLRSTISRSVAKIDEALDGVPNGHMTYDSDESED